jgi:nitric oxide reductase NorD protein
MSWDELLQGVFSSYFSVKNKISKKRHLARIQADNTARLDDIKTRLIVIARAVTGAPVDIFPAEREGGYKNDNFFLPAYFFEFPELTDNIKYYIFRTLYLSVQKRLNLNWQPGQNKSLDESRQQAEKTSGEILKILFDEFPVMEAYYYKLIHHFQQKSSEKYPPDYTFVYGKWMRNNPETGDKNTLKNFNEKVKKAIDEEIETILKAQPVEEMETMQVDKKQQADQVVHNYYEKIETLEEHKGGIWKDFDGDDELDEHQNALDELRMSRTVRVDDDTHSVYETEFLENITVSESREINPADYYLTYDEWDYAKKSYKPDFCKLYPKKVVEKDIAYYKKTIQENATTLMGLRKMLTNINNRYQEQRRQPQGEHFDIDALTDMFIDIYSRHTPNEKIYISNRKREKDLSILLLLDISLSSDGYAAGNRVIDVEKQVAILFGEILDEFKVDFSIDAFYSKTRNFSTFVNLKSFDDDWQKAKYKIGTVQPQGYTRIGTALRHAGSLLQKRPTKNKWVILISDGKPNDYDRYEGKYGINDVKQALRELKVLDINSYALAIEAEAKYYLPQMFGQNHYQILTTPVELLQSLVKLYEKIRH